MTTVRRISHSQIRVALLITTLFLKCVNLGFSQFEPVDGRIQLWNQDWDRLQRSPNRPRGYDLVSLMISDSFNGVVFIALTECQDGSVQAYAAKSDAITFELGKTIIPDIEARARPFDRNLAHRFSSYWVAQLRKTKYEPGPGDTLTQDGVLCYLGGVDIEHSNRFLIGKTSLHTKLGENLQLVQKLIVQYVFSKESRDRDAVMSKLNEQFRKLELTPAAEDSRPENETKPTPLKSHNDPVPGDQIDPRFLPPIRKEESKR